MRRLEPQLVAIVVMVVAAACGRGADSAAAEVGTACPATSGHGRAIALSMLLQSGDGSAGTPSWLRVRKQSQLTREGSPEGSSRQKVRLTAAESVAGAPAAQEESVVLFAGAADEAASELGRGSSVVIVRPVSAASVARVVASVRSDGSVAFLGECAFRHLTTPYDKFVAKRHADGDSRTAAELFYGLAKERALVDDLRASEGVPRATPVPWEARRAQERVIDPDGANPPPAATMADLRSHLVHFAYPEAWRSFDGSIVTYVPDVGWNAALPLSLDSDDPAVQAYASLTKPLEVWVVPAPADISQPLARLAVIDPASLAGADEVYLYAQVEATSRDDLVRQAKAGAVAFKPGPPRG
ncbi:MAG TPA: hypothetical protein VGX28_08935 [Frankiaceae bacterium]|jgi:hypothetical protein|nr:hypothetical protein [Frankiaceae bacterium]